MAKRPTIADLARETGLGVATVDRALNGRPNVSARAIARVAEAAERLGYHASALARLRAAAAERPALTLGFLLQGPGQAFYRQFAQEIERAVRERDDIRGTCRIAHPETPGIDDHHAAIAALAETVDALAVVAPNHPRLSNLLREIAASGLPVFTLLNDLAPEDRRAYFGTDNMKVGRIAAWALTTCLREPGELAIFVGSGRWHGHMMREAGFQAYLRQHAPGFRLLDGLVNLDTPQVTHEAVLELLGRRPDLRGIYVAGGGMEGAIAALREARPPGRVGLVVNELTPESRAALADRYALMVLATPLEELCRRCVAAMIEARRGSAARPGQILLGPQIVVPESL
ncbi:LacI family DNA-binding transcriptional regulator [Albidovulum sp.]